MDMERGSIRAGFGQWLMLERNKRSLTQVDLAERIRAVAKSAGWRAGCDGKTIRRWETGEYYPSRPYMSWIAVTFGIPIEIVEAQANMQAVSGPIPPADAEYIRSLYETNSQLIGLEVVHGGMDVLPVANRYLRELRLRLAMPTNPPSLDSELMAAAGMLIGSTAWIAHDAGDQQTALDLSYESLHYSHLVQDRETAIRTLSHLALFRLFGGVPREALAIARAMLAGPLANYQQVIFQTRMARALAALGGENSDAFRIAQSAVDLFSNGPDSKPAEWWWLDGREVRCHLAETRDAAGRSDLALPVRLADADGPVAMCQGKTWEGLRYLRYVRLLQSALNVGDWQTAEQTLGRIQPFVGEVRSGRVENWLGQALAQLRGQKTAPVSLRDAGQHLGEIYQSVL
jgi:transcriptional regulator with XRE-family HTH domain